MGVRFLSILVGSPSIHKLSHVGFRRGRPVKAKSLDPGVFF